LTRSRERLLEEVAALLAVLGLDRGAEADAVGADPPLDDLVEVRERAAADEEDVRRVDRQNSWWDACAALREPSGRASRIFSSACWTPSPETSRVIDGLSALRAILSTSSM